MSVWVPVWSVTKASATRCWMGGSSLRHTHTHGRCEDTGQSGFSLRFLLKQMEESRRRALFVLGAARQTAQKRTRALRIRTNAKARVEFWQITERQEHSSNAEGHAWSNHLFFWGWGVGREREKSRINHTEAMQREPDLIICTIDGRPL